MALSKQEEKAMFRLSIIFPLLDERLERGERTRLVDGICGREYTIPHSKKRTLCASTVWTWYRDYSEKRTIDALAPSGRSDKGRNRKLSEDSRKQLLALRDRHPRMTVVQLARKAERQGVFAPSEQICMSAIYRLFQHERNGVDPRQEDRRRFSTSTINDCWQADCLHGPKVFDNSGRLVTSKLFLIIDDFSRLFPYGRFYGSETADSFLDCLWEAFRRRGLPRRVYTDNGSSFRDDRLKLGCMALEVKLSFTAPYSAASKGKIERANRTVRMQFLSELPTEPLTLVELNIRWDRYMDRYNHQGHTALEGKSPLEIYLSQLKAVRQAPENLPLYFRKKVTRLVSKARTVSLENVLLQVPLGYAGKKIEIRYFDTDSAEGFFDGKSIGRLPKVDLFANANFARLAPKGRDMR
ncbi:MAG: DDE-type integrase/transposase/recombinase [Sphaerochaeta sp.]|jgi:transposase InsO family protein|nr:DDE-type integrase/transposase/recombinase [Sphaerochaeta sp.]